MRNRIRVENPNHLGGQVRAVEYDVYMSGDRSGPYEYVGNGSIRDLTVPPNGTVTETNEFDIAYEDLISATGGAGVQGLVGGATWYARIDGEAEIALGPASFTVEFESVEEIEP
jgi:LEA14-like dessication related protein